MSNPRTFFDLTVGDKPLGRVVFELFKDVVPRTAENFRALCTGEKGTSSSGSVPLHYKNSPVHRIIDGFMIQGGDFTKRNGTGGESIYGGQFDDERLEGKGTEVDREGLLVMANRGPNMNGSQWFITLAPAQHLTGKHVVFGRVVHGLEHVLTLGKLPTDARDRPLSPVIITHCGELELRRPPPPKARSPSPVSSRSSSRSRSRSPPPRRRRYTSSPISSEDEKAKRRREKKERKERRREKKEKKKSKSGQADKGPIEETESDLDARLEREENERLEAQRLEREKREEEEKRRIEEKGGVVYKGRGAMRYLDTESIASRSLPINYNSRGPSVRPRRDYRNGPGQPENDRWIKGVDARPVFQAEDRRRGLEGYSTKGEDRRRAVGDKDNWRSREWMSKMGGSKFEKAREASPQRNERPQTPPTPSRRSATPPVRADSPLRGDAESDMEMDD